MRRLSFAVALAATLAGCRAPGPAADTADRPLTRAALAHSDFRWRSAETPNATVYAPADSYAAGQLPRLRRAVEEARRDGLALLQVASFPDQLDVFLVESREQMRSLVGRPVGGWGAWQETAVFAVHTAATHAALRHETMHVLSWRLWGIPAEGWLSEGLAMYAGHGCLGHDLHALARAAERDGRWVPLADLVRGFDPRRAETYVEAGSLVQFIHETYGLDALRALWRTGFGGSRAVLGLEPAALEAAWRRRLARDRAAPGPAIWDEIRAHGCEQPTSAT